ncbi:MAG: hypothetical protein MJ201_04600 [Mycoplasmoidaceae bacterium]|nr:hypothetical protein [Mycoplasmoidaceae bacterium]
MGLFNNTVKARNVPTRSYQCPKCGFTMTKSVSGLVGSITAMKTPKCPKCKTKMELTGTTN